MHRIALAAFAALAACSSAPAPRPAATPSQAASASPAAVAVDESAMDPSADPCDDFYQYACGGWMKANPIPPDKSRWTRSFDTVNERNQMLLREILEKDAAGQGDPADPYAKKAGDFYATCMDEPKAETASLKSLQESLASIDAVKDPKQLAQRVGEMHLTGARNFFLFRSIQDAKDATQVIGLADQGGLGLPDRDYYVKDDPKMQETRKRYQEFAANLFELAGVPEADARKQAETVMRIETALAKSSMTRVDRRDPYKVYHRLDRKGLQEKAPRFDWNAYFASIGHDVQPINVAVPEFFTGLEAVLVESPLPEVKTYLRFREIHADADALGKAFVEENFRFNQFLTGQKEIAPRWKRCVQMTDAALGEAVGRTFVKTTIGDQGKSIAKQMIQGIEKAFDANLALVSWMDDATRKASAEKLHKLDNKVGYPDRWREYDSMKIDRTSLLANLKEGARYAAKRDLDMIGKPVDRNEWGMTPATVNAYYNAGKNEMVFPAGILQTPFFAPGAPDPTNLGGAGLVMGHELTHGFDDRGRQYDGDGNLREWWTPQVAEAYKERAACVANQYDQYVATDDVHVNGKLTLGENIADIGGLKLALAALRANGQPRPGTSRFTPEQQLFLSFGQVWCQNATPQERRLRAVTDPHSPGRWRVNGPVSDNEDFGKVFSCKSGTNMNPVKKCVVW
ncbi:MAG TPA: M13 family metallopeptidase [Myxococcales bacterium]|nr:M13 family metallopeptidase [Myxococcales bacterium]